MGIKLIKGFVGIALVLTVLVGNLLPNVVHAQESDVCEGSKKLEWPFPAEDPCAGTTGVWVAVQLWSDTSDGADYGTAGKKSFDGADRYADMLADAADYDGGSAWFEAGGSEEEDTSSDSKGSKSGESSAVSEDTLPNAWTKRVCSGANGLPYQGEEEQGDGVTVKTSDPTPCDGYWFVVEPWGPQGFNPDSGCLAKSWKEVDELANRAEWPNGSVWKVAPSYAENPLVVLCSTVNNGEQLGLNRYERQIEPGRLTWVMKRTSDLLETAKMSLADYCKKYGSEPLGKNLVCLELQPAK